MSNNKWNYTEFTAFLLIYAAHADIDFSKEEQDMIKEKVGEETFDHMYQEFQNMTDFQVLQTIQSYKGLYYPTSARKKELMDTMKTLFMSDGEYSSMEQTLFMFLDHLL